jgi:hypothetical protein
MKYHIHLVPGALPILLTSVKNQIEELEDAQAYERFKKLVLSKHPTTPVQFVDVFLEEFENGSWREIGFLSKLFLEHGFPYDVCDVDRFCHDRVRALELTRFEQSLHERKSTNFPDIDTMTGSEFEDFVMDLFIKLGYRVDRRKRSHEQGLNLFL